MEKFLFGKSPFGFWGEKSPDLGFQITDWLEKRRLSLRAKRKDADENRLQSALVAGVELLVGVVGVGGQHIKVAVQNFLFFPSKGFAEFVNEGFNFLQIFLGGGVGQNLLGQVGRQLFGAQENLQNLLLFSGMR